MMKLTNDTDKLSIPVTAFQVERLDVGAFVSIRGIGRVKIVQFVQVNYRCLIYTLFV